MYPKIKINVKGIIENMHYVTHVCEENGIQPAIVTKLLADEPEIVAEMVKNGAKIICDSRIMNLKSYQDLPAEKWLIRAPSIEEAEETVKYADVSLNSELNTIRALNQAGETQQKKHKIILMYELGDLREGCFKEELRYIIHECTTLSYIEVSGIGTNLSCYGEIIPTEQNMAEFVSVVNEIEKEFSLPLQYVSGGNSSSYPLLVAKKLPAPINNLRLGEVIYLGNIPCFEEKVPELHQDNFVIQAPIIELKEKPSIPWGTTGKSNSFGEHRTFVDNGIRKRAIIELGRQDIKIDGITPLDENITLLAGSSDHIILDVTDCQKEYQVGDIVSFKPNYAGVLSAMTSKYIEKEIEK